MKKPDILAALDPVVKVFEKIGISYYLGGSVASSAYGIARATLDVDLVADLSAQHVNPLTEMLKADYYIDKEMILDAIKRRSSFNIIHLETMLKVDIFIIKDRPYDGVAFQRKRKDTLDEEQGAAEFYFASPEDIILNKLEWFQMGGKVSERQWHDVLGIMKVQSELMDKEYLRHWAKKLGISDLLEQAFRDASC
ncbi:MAG: hypothetical protein JRC57_04350 [Deltaproteobacteria bacterium]|jgi:hypothetical protein|nr:hypothetical protein [Deltaproteobacteria bacterium]MBW2652304.1 hypothetical protein [Deltaproteobacteria bacterium]